MPIFEAMWTVTLSLAPWMLLGMAIAGILHVALPRDLVHRQLSGRWGVLKAVLLGVPLPLCSCGVIPAALGLKKDGASNGAVVGFLISTPQTGVDSILVSSSFLGWPFALFKVLSAAATGMIGGALTDAVDPASAAGPPSAAGEEPGARRGARAAIDYGLMILRTIWHWIVFGIVASALIEVLVPDSFFAGLGSLGTVVPALAALAISLPLYVCATASVPIAAALVASGMPPGAALVFLMAGPATNVATVGAIYRGLGKKALAVYLGTIVAGSLAAAFVFDFVLTAAPQTMPHEHHDHGWWAVAAAVVVLALMAWFAVDDLRGWIARRSARNVADRPAIELGVEGMHCSACVSKLERALLQEEGVASAEVTLEPGKAVVRGSISRERIRQLVERLGYRAS